MFLIDFYAMTRLLNLALLQSCFNNLGMYFGTTTLQVYPSIPQAPASRAKLCRLEMM